MSSKMKIGTFGANGGKKCEHCKIVYWHGAHCGCKADQIARGVWSEPKGFFVMEF